MSLINFVKLFASNNFIVLNIDFLHKFGINETIILCELGAEYDHWDKNGKLIDDMFYCSISKLTERTALTETKQRTAIKHLEELGVITTTLKGVPPTRYFRINTGVILDYIAETQEISQFLENLRFKTEKTSDLNPRNPCQSNNIIINNKINNKTNTKVLVAEQSPATEISKNDFNNSFLKQLPEENDLGIPKPLFSTNAETDCFSTEDTESVPKNTNTGKKQKTTRKKITTEEQKPKKLNKYQKCHVILDDYMANEDEKGGELYEVLGSYLDFRLELKDKPFYSNQWKGMLKKLDSLTNDYNTKVSIVQQSLNRGYLGFFEVKQYNKSSIMEKAHNKGVKCDTYTDDEIRQLEKLEDERKKKGMRTEF